MEGIENLKELKSFVFDQNQIENLAPIQNVLTLKFLSGNENKVKSLKGLENLKSLRHLSVCTYVLIQMTTRSKASTN